MAYRSVFTSTPPMSVTRRILASLATGAVVAVLAHVLTVFTFFLVEGADPAQFAPVAEFFQISALLALILFSLAAALEAFHRWYVTLPTALLASLVSAYFGTLLGVVAQGVTIDGVIVELLARSLIGPNLVFVVACCVIAPTVGIAVWRVSSGDRGPADSQPVALVRLPSSTLADGLVTHIEPSSVDVDRADGQWEAYTARFAEYGWEVLEFPVAEGFADSVFVEDTVVVLGDVAVMGAPGHPSRVGEGDGVEEILHGLGFAIERIEHPGTLEGGDVLTVGDTVYVGSSGRTNSEGIRQFRRIAGELGYRVVAVPVSRALHLKTAASALPDGTIVGHPELLDTTEVFERFVPVPERLGAAVVALDDETVLVSAAAPKTAELIESLGYRVVTTQIGEFEKLEGGLTCMSVRVR